MRAEFLIAEEDQTLFMPYGKGTARGRGGDGKNNGYINLELQPERMDEIHELRRFPELRRSLEIILQETDSVFHSLRVDSCLDEHIEPRFKNSCFSMLTMVFREPGDNDFEWFRYFFNDLTNFAKSKRIGDRVTIIFVVNPLQIKALTFSGLCLDIRIIGSGYSQPDARGQWVEGMRCLNASLIRWSERVRQQELVETL